MITNMTILSRIEAIAGTVLRYDDRTCLWTSQGVVDLRDVLKRCKGISLADAMDALHEAVEAEHKRIKVQRQAEKDKETTI